MNKNAQWFIDNGCELVNLDVRVFLGVYALSMGQPCNGCNCKDTCPAWPKLNASTLKAPMPQVRTGPTCPKCKSPLNMKKVERRGGKCACGQVIP